MTIPKELIQNFITSEFKENKLTTTGEYQVNSFFTTDTKRKLYINSRNGVWIDFKTDERGSFLKLVKEYLGLNNYYDALNYLVANYDFKLDKNEEIAARNENELIDNFVQVKNFLNKDKPVFFTEPDKLGVVGKNAYDYVLSRKIEPEYIPKLGYVFNDASKYNERIIIPFFEKGAMNYFIARAMDPKNPLRYRNPDGLDSKGVLFNIDNINEEVIIAEGTFDAMSITVEQPATCLLSADIGVEQMNKLFSKHPKTIIYVPDNDETGARKMKQNISKLLTYCPYSGLDIYIYHTQEPYKDLNEQKIATGKNYILKKECEKYGNSLMDRKLF